jgi:hypothetical protein
MKISRWVFLGIAACTFLFSGAVFAQPPSWPCDPCVTYCTYTQGGWGAPGGSAGQLRDQYFDTVYPADLTIGLTDGAPHHYLTFTDAQAIEDFLPQGQTATCLPYSATDPGATNITVFAGQVLALRLNVDFGAAPGVPGMPDISGVHIASGPFAGWTVGELLDAANTALGCGALPPGHTIGELNEACDHINNSWDDCTRHNDYLESGSQNVLIRDEGQEMPQSVCLTFTNDCPDVCLVWWCQYCQPGDIGVFTWYPGCNGPNCNEDCAPNVGGITWGDQSVYAEDPNGGCWWFVPIHADEPGCICVTLDHQLAVNLTEFTAIPGDNEVRLEWTTASERANDHFDIQRATDNSTWTSIGHMNGQGTVSTPTHYSFVDNQAVNGGSYHYKLISVDINGQSEQVGNVITTSPSPNAAAPLEYALYQNYPNPFNPTTSISFDLVASGNASLKVFNMIGQEVATLVNGNLSAGRHSVSFDGRNLPSALYIYRLEANGFVQQRKMLLIK